MSQIIWEPLDLLNVLGVIPEIDEYETSHKYVISQPPMRLEVLLTQYDGDVEFKLFVAPFATEVLRFSMLECPRVRAAHDKRGQYLEFAATNAFTGRYDGYSVIPYGIRVWIEPHILLEPFSYPD